MIDQIKTFKDSNPVEAQAREVEIAALIEKAIKNHDTDPWCVKLFSRYPSLQEWEDNPDRAGFIHDLLEASGFSVGYSQGDVPGWIVKDSKLSQTKLHGGN